MSARRIPKDLSKLERQAAQVLAPEPLAYILAGAGDAQTTRANAQAFRQWHIKRRKTRNRPKRDLSTTVLGTRTPARFSSRRSGFRNWHTRTPSWPAPAPPPT